MQEGVREVLYLLRQSCHQHAAGAARSATLIQLSALPPLEQAAAAVAVVAWQQQLPGRLLLLAAALI
jgi:hypothetical protein